VLGGAAGRGVTRRRAGRGTRRPFFDAGVGWQALPDVAAGFWLNVRVFTVAPSSDASFGLGIALLRTLRGPVFWPVRAFALVYVDLFRGLPLILVLLLVGFGVPGLRLQGVPTSAVVLGTVALVLTYSAYAAEVFRAGIESVHPSQRAAARSLGLSAGQTMRHVVLPQAVRRVVPPLLNDVVSLTKDSGLISVLGAIDAVRSAQIVTAKTFDFTPYVVAGGLFVLLTIPLTRLTDAVSRRYGYLPSGGHL
jgi:polar amino acid transport system permease protein